MFPRRRRLCNDGEGNSSGRINEKFAEMQAGTSATMSRPQQFPLAQKSAGHAPPRLPGSIRRTTSIDSDWPDGQGQPWEMIGRGRDLLTPMLGEPVELAAASFRLIASPARAIMELGTSPEHPRAQELVGVRSGAASRTALGEKMGDLRGTPLFQLLDDFAGASLVAGWIWSRWRDEPNDARLDFGPERRARMINVCTGFAEGSSSLLDVAAPGAVMASSTAVGPLENPDDPLGWHMMARQHGPQMRRARRIDLWREGAVIKVDAAFQDSGSARDGGRVAIHEYRVYADVDAERGALLALESQPLILPYRECPGASIEAARMIGQPLEKFRTAVIETLPATLGCTHLNDVLRALADVPALAEMLPPRSA
jgi:hypothetical protein